ncbi:hypothetical protein ABWL39_03435 [Chitinivorax sp. PXF-14]|uniref:hypothetical protein n=1 Tax=Chitinivorax sp. PXF-14 TaxID=3230488 RepID=UPI003466446B
MKLAIKTIINGAEIPYTRVLEWERRRALVVLRKLGVKPAGRDLAGMRQQLAERKQALGAAGMMRILRRELALSGPLATLTAALSCGRRRFSVTELVMSGGTAEQFVDWLNERARINDERSMLAGTPDHYLIRIGANGVQDVVETNGGSPLAARFFIDYQDLSSLRSPVDPAYPLQVAGVARSGGGRAIGGVRHQFRNEGTGFRARLLVEFPLLMLPQVVTGHQWHLASEFSNWIEAAFA